MTLTLAIPPMKSPDRVILPLCLILNGFNKGTIQKQGRSFAHDPEKGHTGFPKKIMPEEGVR
jgi:hypothetical protein